MTALVPTLRIVDWNAKVRAESVGAGVKLANVKMEALILKQFADGLEVPAAREEA